MFAHMSCYLCLYTSPILFSILTYSFSLVHDGLLENNQRVIGSRQGTHCTRPQGVCIYIKIEIIQK